ncbi:hypothetical protein BYT27DRAFT_7241718 [Phlegmacium glaucopus]|nr:hypothetical protein BYT27DRAFT_7241718 [Phlegmacium glaucopus]
MGDHILIDKEVRRREQNNACLRKQEEDHRLIVDGEGLGPRKAKTTALKNASSLERDCRKEGRVEVRARRECLRTRNLEVFRKVGSNRDSDVHVHKGLKPPTKGKSAEVTKTRSIEVDDDSPSLSELDDGDSHDPEKLNPSSDDGGDDDDEDFYVAEITDQEARQMFDDKMPQDAADPALLFDNDNGVKIASSRSHRSRGDSSSEASQPPTSESEGMFDDPGNSGEEEVDDDSNFPRHVSVSSRGSNVSKSGQRPSKRDAALNAERPTMQVAHSRVQKSKSRMGAFTIESDDNNQTAPKDSWPKALQLRTGALTQQTDLIRAVCREAIHIVKKTLVMQHAWPELHKEAVNVLHAKNIDDDEGKQDAQYKALNTQLSNDKKFVRCIGKWIRSVALDQIAVFQLGIGEGCSQRVRALIENDVYVYPGHWAVDKDSKPVWMVKNSLTDIQIYLNPGLVKLIKMAFFNGPTGFGYKFKQYYVSLHPDHKEPELIIPIIALGAMAFFAALYEWCEGKKGKMSSDSQKAKAKKFEGDNFKKVYDWHMETLTKLKKKINTYHKFMVELYLKVTDGDNPDTGALIKGSALAVLDLDGLD